MSWVPRSSASAVPVPEPDREEGDPRPALARVRRYLLTRVVVVGALWAGVCLGSVLLVATLVVGSEGWAQGTWLPLLLHLVAVGGIVGGVVALWRWGRRTLARRAVASRAGEVLGLPRGAVLVALELAEPMPPGTSETLARAGAGRLANELGRHPSSHLAGPLAGRLTGWIQAGGAALAFLVTFLLVLGFMAPDRSGAAWAGVLQPYQLLAEPVHPALAVTPGNAEVERGEDVEVEVAAVGREEVFLRHQPEGEATATDTLPVADGTAFATLEGVDAPVTYSVEDPRGARSESYRLEPVDPLMLSHVRLELTFPEHTGLPPETYDEAPAELSVPEGTRVAVEGRANRRLEGAELRLDEEDTEAPDEPADGPAQPSETFEVEGDAFSGIWEPPASGRWSWYLVQEGAPSMDTGGDEAGDGFGQLQVEVVPDEPPVVAILSPGPMEDLPFSFRQPLEVEAVDDHGVAEVELVAWPVDEAGQEGEVRTHRMDAGGNREARLSPVLDVAGWDLSPGDEVRYLARAVDNAPDPGVGESEEHVLRLPGSSELRQESRDALAGAADRVDELQSRAGESASRVQELERSHQRSDAQDDSPFGSPDRPEEEGGDFQEAEALDQALEGREDLIDEVGELRSELEELAQGLREAGVLDADLQQDLRELGGILDDLAPEDAAEELEEWRDQLEEEGADARGDVMRELGDSQEALRDRLQDSLERFRRAAAEEEFRSLTEEGRQVAEEEEALAERFAEEADEETRAADAEAQEALGERAEELARESEGMAERLEAMAEPEAAERARDARERFQEAQEAMDRASQQAQEGDGDAAAQEAQDAAQAMDEGTDELEDAHQEMADQWAEALEEALQEVAAGALSLARLQDDITRSMMEGGRVEPHVLRRREAAVLDGARSLARSTRQVAPMDPDLAGRLAAALGVAMDAMQETAGALGGVGAPTASAVVRASSAGAADGLNRVGRLAMEGPGSGEGGGADAMAEALEQLDQLAEQQQELSDAAGDLMEMGDDDIQEGAQELGPQQDEVAEGLHELGQLPGFDEGSLGDVEALEEEAREVAQELEEGRMDPEIRDRQEELFRRLLDAGRGIEEQGQGDHREGTPADEEGFERPDVDALDPAALNPLRFPVPDATELEGLAPAQRRLVVEYFQRLNRGGEEPAPPPEDGGS